MDATIYGISIWGTTLVFARVGAMIMLLPAFGESTIPSRIRLSFALMLAMAIAPNVTQNLPAPADTSLGISAQIGQETVIGIMLGAAARMLMSALSTAGQSMGMETGLSFAQIADPTSGGQSAQLFAVFLNLMGVTLIFATGLDRMFLAGVSGSYEVIHLGAQAPVGDAAQLALNAVSTSFRVGFQIAAPVIAAGLIFRVGLGVLARLIPSIQVFFVALPLQVMGGFAIIALGLSGGMLLWLDSLQQYATWLR